MGNIKRYTQLETTDYGAASLPAAKFSELLEHGTVVVANSSATYLVFDTAFGGTPTLVVTGVGAAGTVPQLNHAPTSGSAHIDLSTSGSVVVHYIAWGAR